MTMSSQDLTHMREALSLAERGLYSTTPNPRVGCVIVNQSQVVGRGWHERTGGNHAEVVALLEAGPKALGATAYVTLEPCNHQGLTPPCVDALINAGIARVVVAVLDPDPRTAGQGVSRLQEAGLEVTVGLAQEEAFELNIGFMCRHQQHRPFYRLKLAASLDGRATAPDGLSQWITGEHARSDVHTWRARACAVVTGIGTVLSDDPHMTARPQDSERPIRQPVRVILDSRARLPEHAKILQGEGSVLVLSGSEPPAWASRKTSDELKWVQLATDDSGQLKMEAVIACLNQQSWNEVHIEAGPILSGGWLAEGIVDEILLYQAGCFLGEGKSLVDLPKLRHLDDRIAFDPIGCDILGCDLRLRLRSPSALTIGYQSEN